MSIIVQLKLSIIMYDFKFRVFRLRVTMLPRTIWNGVRPPEYAKGTLGCRLGVKLEQWRVHLC